MFGLISKKIIMLMNGWDTLGCIHDKSLWLYMLHLINKKEVRVITRLCSTRLVLALKSMKNEVVMWLTSTKYDKRALIVKDIVDLAIKYATMMIGYRIYFTKGENFVSATMKNIASTLCGQLRILTITNQKS